MTTSIQADQACLRRTVDFTREHDTATLLPLLLPGLAGSELRALADRCRFAHTAVLVFPPDLDTLHDQLADCGLTVENPPQPSVVVRQRLAARHRREPAELEVGILRPAVLGLDGGRREVEVFALTVPPGSALAGLAALERTHQHEAHLAFEVERPDPLVLHGLRAILARCGARADGGGYNPHEDGTVLYFTAPADSRTGYRRIELHAAGEHREVLSAHLAEHRTGQPAETLLRLLTGAWTTQALATAARLRVPEALDTAKATGSAEAASRVGAEPRALAALLRYLAMLGAVVEQDGGWRLTALGALLRAEEPASMRALALMYGGPFYRSFAELDHTLRTGGTAFDHLFGENHFDHFARDPELAELFDQSMAASTRMFEPLPTHPAITAAARAAEPRTVIDVAGGTGELLGRILTAHPGLHGVLLERPHVVAAARRSLAALGERCDFRAGDFAEVPAGGDVYLLSRVLHDWDDDRCREILRHCARAMPAHADLLVVERLLPADGSPSLATAWDLHMMCNVGGRERTAAHYDRLFADAGLAVVGSAPLPLDAAVLHVRRAAVPAPARTGRRS